jgi:hypothetical protein
METAREVIAGARLHREKAEQDVRQRHRENYIYLDIDRCRRGLAVSSAECKQGAKK